MMRNKTFHILIYRNTYEYQIEDTSDEDEYCENDGECSGYGIKCIGGKCVPDALPQHTVG